MGRMTRKVIWAEMARRKLQFHAKEPWERINLWGLFNWGDVKPLLDEGLLITGMRKENKVIWVRPSEKAWAEKIKPLLDRYDLNELTTIAGWR